MCARSLQCIGVGFALCAAVAAHATEAAPVRVDHHMHARSEAALDALRRAQRALGEPVKAETAGSLTGTEAVAMLDEAGLEQGVLLSLAYLYGVPEVDFEDEYTRVRAENDFVAEEVRRFPDRLVGFGSVDPLAGYAIDEIRRIAETDGLTGLKLHLANSDVDLRDAAHRDRLADVFAEAERWGLPVVIHLRTRAPDYGAEDVRIFMEHVLPATSSIPVQIAHIGGWSGFDEATASAVQAFVAGIEEAPALASRLYFDAAAVFVPLSRAGGRADLEDQVAAINHGALEAVRDLGPERVVFGSDWDSGTTNVAAYLTGLRDTLGADAEVLRGEAPYLD